MTTPPQFREPTARSARLTIKEVAAASSKSKAAEAEHAKALAEFQSENPNWTHQYGQVRLSDMVVDPTIQRPEQGGEIATLVRNWNLMALGMFTLSHRVYPATETEPERVELVVLDGQQRRAAGLIKGYEGLVHADVHYGLTRRDEAKLFRQLNFRKAVNWITLFKTALVEEIPEALAVQAVLDGLDIPFGTNKGYSAGQGSMRLVSRKNGVTHLEWALRQTKRLWDRGNGGVYDAVVVEALFLMHERYGNRIDEARLYDRLASDEGSNAPLVEFGKTQARVKKSTLIVGIIRAITDRYNKNLSTRSRNYLPDLE